MNKKQLITVLSAVVLALTELVNTGLLDPKWAIVALGVTNVISAFLPGLPTKKTKPAEPQPEE